MMPARFSNLDTKEEPQLEPSSADRAEPYSVPTAPFLGGGYTATATPLTDGQAERQLRGQLRFASEHRGRLAELLGQLDAQLGILKSTLAERGEGLSGDDCIVLAERPPIVQEPWRMPPTFPRKRSKLPTGTLATDDVKVTAAIGNGDCIVEPGGENVVEKPAEYSREGGYHHEVFAKLPVWCEAPTQAQHFSADAAAKRDSGGAQKPPGTPGNATSDEPASPVFGRRIKCPDWRHPNFMLHPQGATRATWDVLSLLLVLLDLILIPMAAFPVGEGAFFIAFEWTTRLFWTLDMVMSLLSGYMNSFGDIEMDPRAVLRRYLRTWFCPDVIIVGVDWTEVVVKTALQGSGYDAGYLASMARIFRITRLLRLMRLARVRDTLSTYAEYIQSDTFTIVLGLFKLLVCMLAFSHFLACLWYLVGANYDGGWVEHYGFLGVSVETSYLSAFRWGQSQFSGGMDEVQPQTFQEQLLAAAAAVICFLASDLFQGILTSSMTQLYFNHSKSYQHMSTLKKFLTESGITKKLKVRVCRNAQYALDNKKVEMTQELSACVSQPLLIEIDFEVNSPKVKTHPFFSMYLQMNNIAMRRVCHEAMSSESFAQGDIIFSAGERLSRPKMLIVGGGSLEYAAKISLVHTELTEGQWVSEMPLWIAWVHRGTLTSKTESHCCTVDALLFQDIVSQFHVRHAWDPWEYAENFVTNLNSADAIHVTDLPLPAGIVSVRPPKSSRSGVVAPSSGAKSA